FSYLLVGKRITGLGRRGKYLLFHLADGYDLVAHLRMTGRLTLAAGADPLLPHTHVIIHLDSGPCLRWTDTRRFGRLYLGQADRVLAAAGVQELGPEPLDPAFDVAALAAICAGRRRPLKQVLLDQHLLAGIGNIYADETLFLAGLHPLRPAASLSGEEVARLHQSMRVVLEQGIANYGTSIRDYVDSSGRRGRNQDCLQVYGRVGQPCGRCGRTLERLKIGGRTTVFCPACQPLE
ncbi:MAG: DNA-formamidopyrimidine glycosylase, partial [Moorella sp. (in: Bacteria)]|nr:DNA-formamidopyrimidine glycosylase [Moorella sp. (in: firmicutes)]